MSAENNHSVQLKPENKPNIAVEIVLEIHKEEIGLVDTGCFGGTTRKCQPPYEWLMDS